MASVPSAISAFYLCKLGGYGGAVLGRDYPLGGEHGHMGDAALYIPERTSWNPVTMDELKSLILFHPASFEKRPAQVS